MGERMKTRSFIGKSVALEDVQSADGLVWHDVEDYDEEYAVAEIFLRDFDCDGHTDGAGMNAYSVRLYLDGERIAKIERVGHCHMCGGQGSDDELDRFPHQSLEEEAQDVINHLLK
jgi:hypothetical protein